jgi:hypothetical protein
MTRLLLRVLGLVMLAGAFVSCVIDGASSIADSRLSITRLGDTAVRAFPTKFPLLQHVVEQVHPLLWDPILLNILKAPTWAVLGLFGAALLYAMRRRPPPIGHSNRSR